MNSYMSDVSPKVFGWLLIFFGFGGFLLWASFSPLDSGVSAPGIVMISGYRKAVQPLVGGKVTEVLVKEGSEVTEGQVLVRLDDSQSKSQFEITRGQWISLKAIEARLVSEQSGFERVAYSSELLTLRTDKRTVDAVNLQNHLFKTRTSLLKSDINSMSENIQGIEIQLTGIEASKTAKEGQLRIAREMSLNQTLLANEGFLARNRALELERNLFAISGAISEDVGAIGKNRQLVAEIKSRQTARRQDYLREVQSQLSDVQKEISSLESRMDALKFDLDNMVVKAPASGVVLGMAVHTIGGVVATGAPLMEILPSNEKLQIEAQVPPHLIDKVSIGTDVNILFSALNQVTTPRIPGRVVQLSADVLADAKQTNQFFRANIEVTSDGLIMLRKNEIRPGMPVEVFIRTGERSALSYFTKPLRDRLSHALTEP